MSRHAGVLEPRQLWNLPTSTDASKTAHCTPFTLPSHGVISIRSDHVITLASNVLFQPECTGTRSSYVSTTPDLKDPFYASTIPQSYVIATCTVIAWLLVILLIITPRTNFIGNLGAQPGWNGHGIIGGATGGGTNLIGVGSRPWLQKVAALTVAVSLTIVTADAFKAAKSQYDVGYTNASALRDEVLGSLEVRTTRVISDVFLWLAQVQTLIRLFPRHKEKVLIKWIGFALIIFDSTFSCLNSFYVNTRYYRPRHFTDAIPALSYLFELALGLLYAAWVIYYAITKRRYAFYHPKMRNICLIALLSLIAVLVPVVFFVTDVSNSDVAGWGDYFRWVGAAAASVVVWEWVERIEALERDEKKDGILGREIFDGDEMLDVTPSDELVFTHGRHGRHRYRRDDGSGDDGRDGGNHPTALELGFQSLAQRFRSKPREKKQHFPLGRAHSQTTTATPEPVLNANANGRIAFGALPKPQDREHQHSVLGGITPPPPVASPISRADTTSAASTVYVVRYDTVADVPQSVRRRVNRDMNGDAAQAPALAGLQQRRSTQGGSRPEQASQVAEAHEQPTPNQDRNAQDKWYSVSNPFKRKRASPPAEVQQARQQATAESPAGEATTTSQGLAHLNFRNRIGAMAAEASGRSRDRTSRRRPEEDLPLTVIPAQARGSGRAWSPQEASSSQ